MTAHPRNGCRREVGEALHPCGQADHRHSDRWRFPQALSFWLRHPRRESRWRQISDCKARAPEIQQDKLSEPFLREAPACPPVSPPSPLDSATDPSASCVIQRDFGPYSSHHSCGHLTRPHSRWALNQVHQISAHLRRTCAQVRQTFAQVRRDLSQVKEHRHITAGISSFPSVFRSPSTNFPDVSSPFSAVPANISQPPANLRARPTDSHADPTHFRLNPPDLGES